MRCSLCNLQHHLGPEDARWSPVLGLQAVWKEGVVRMSAPCGYELGAVMVCWHDEDEHFISMSSIPSHCIACGKEHPHFYTPMVPCKVCGGSGQQVTDMELTDSDNPKFKLITFRGDPCPAGCRDGRVSAEGGDDE